jgi:hypothetical protein
LSLMRGNFRLAGGAKWALANCYNAIRRREPRNGFSARVEAGA